MMLEAGSSPLVEDNMVQGRFRNAVYCCDGALGEFHRNTLKGFSRFGVVMMTKAAPVVENNCLYVVGARGGFAIPDRNDADASSTIGAMMASNLLVYEGEV